MGTNTATHRHLITTLVAKLFLKEFVDGDSAPRVRDSGTWMRPRRKTDDSGQRSGVRDQTTEVRDEARARRKFESQVRREKTDGWKPVFTEGREGNEERLCERVNTYGRTKPPVRRAHMRPSKALARSSIQNHRRLNMLFGSSSGFMFVCRCVD
jgi:hypothetical protein